MLPSYISSQCIIRHDEWLFCQDGLTIMSLSALREDVCFFSFQYTFIGYVFEWSSTFAIHVHDFSCLLTLNNHWDVIRYFLTLTLPHSYANLCEMGAGLSERQCIIPATLAGSAVKDNIRSAQGQPVCELSVISLMAQQYWLCLSSGM